ncbi:MAG: DUF3179 domain-containing (seleno)protein [Acidobacteriota bacterium]
MARSKSLFYLGLTLALLPALLRYYLTWPLPGSQELDSIHWVYSLEKSMPWTAAVGLLMAAVGLIGLVRQRPARKTLVWVGIACVVAVCLYGVTIKYAAPSMFGPVPEARFARGTTDELPPETLVMGITSGSQAKAYPIRLLAYHHRVDDELNGDPIWVTYCTMCRTGKIFRPIVDGRQLELDLVGAVRYNSFYRDRATGTYWYQANGRAVVGPMTGSVLPELRSDQMTLANWLELYPDSEVMQPDPASSEGYKLFSFDKIDEVRSKTDNPPGWQWVVGIVHDGTARGYPWAELATTRLIQDQLGELPLAIQLHSDGVSQRVWDRRLDGRVLDLELVPEGDQLFDATSGSTFGFDGVAVDGELAGQSLQAVPASVEFRHSFETFSGSDIYQAGLGA